MPSRRRSGVVTAHRLWCAWRTAGRSFLSRRLRCGGRLCAGPAGRLRSRGCRRLLLRASAAACARYLRMASSTASLSERSGWRALTAAMMSSLRSSVVFTWELVSHPPRLGNVEFQLGVAGVVLTARRSHTWVVDGPGWPGTDHVV